MRKTRLLNAVAANANPRHRVGVSGNRVSAHGVSEHGVSGYAAEGLRGDARAVASLTSIAAIGARRRLTGDTGVGSAGNGTPAGTMHRAPDWHARLSSKAGAPRVLAIVRDGELSSLPDVPQAVRRVVLLLDVGSS